MSPNRPRTLNLKGRVISGNGEGAKYIQLPWVTAQIKQKLGFTPYPGTLNIELTESKRSLKEILKKAKPVRIEPVKGFCTAECYKAIIADGVECAVILPHITGYLESTMELIAAINLRQRLRIADGDLVEVKITL